MPYDPEALADYIGGAPDQACSAKTARAMAMAAFTRARRFEPPGKNLFGIGCSAALTTDRARRGTDRCYVAVQSLACTVEYSLTLSRQGRDRTAQEGLCADTVIHAMLRAADIDGALPALLPDESLSQREQPALDAWTGLFSGHPACTSHAVTKPRLLFPGAFNPLHDGHRQMAKLATRITGETILLEISAFNVDKPPLDFISLQERADGLGDEFAFTFSNTPTFVDKAGLFPGATFVVGSDTLARIGAPRYYHDSVDLRDRAIDTIAARGVTFLVFGRVSDGTFLGLEDIDIPVALRNISRGVSEDEFRVDVSSTHLRRE